MKKHKQAPAPVSLGGLFPDSEDKGSAEFVNETEIVKVTVGNMELAIRQMAWHGANANQIWPGTFTLVDYLLQNSKYHDSRMLELGAATGALSLALVKAGNFDIITSDIDDEGVVQENIAWNFSHNGVEPIRHIPHTWGSGWSSGAEPLNVKFLIASDILLYVSAYDALVQTVCEIFAAEPLLEEFVMCWNRRIAESEIFFDKIRTVGFTMVTHGSGLYSFRKAEEGTVGT